MKFQDAVHPVSEKQTRKDNCSFQEIDANRVSDEIVPEEEGELEIERPSYPFACPWRDKGANGTSAPFTFIDLFAGIGGMRLAFHQHMGQCLFSSERDDQCHETYHENFGDWPRGGDTAKIPPDDIPTHDILTAGFPCQPFSLAGVSKKKSLGREHGFLDKAQGTLFFNVAKIIQCKRPKMFLLENVKNLRSHDKGRTFEVIEGALEELEYHLFYKVVDARPYVPQHRERIFIVGVDKKIVGVDKTVFRNSRAFEFPAPPASARPTLETILDEYVDSKYSLSPKLWTYLQRHAAKHKKKGNGFGYGLFGPGDTARTLSARYYKDGSEILIKVPHSPNPRRLTPRECARLQGFPVKFKIVVSDLHAYKQFGNSVVVPLVTAIAEQMVAIFKAHKNRQNVKARR